MPTLSMMDAGQMGRSSSVGAYRRRRNRREKGRSCPDARGNRRGIEGTDASACWLFARNLPHNVGVEALKRVFASYGEVAKICVMSGRSAEMRACAFIKFLNRDEAALAADMLHGRYEMEPGSGPFLVRADAPGVFLKLPVDINEEMVQQLFSLYGRVETVHIAPLVKREDPSPPHESSAPSSGDSADRPRRRRGDSARAFVEYSSAEEAEAAALALRSDPNPWAPQPGEIDAAAPSSKNQGINDIGSAPIAYCVVCLEQPQTHAFVPCGHRCVCAECGIAVAGQPQSRCPVCRDDVGFVLQIFC